MLNSVTHLLNGRGLHVMTKHNAEGTMSCEAKRTHLHTALCHLQIPHGRWDALADMHNRCAEKKELSEQVHPAQCIVQGI
jgi:hypothetical protein